MGRTENLAKLHIHSLGVFQTTLDGEPLAFDTDKSRALLAYLVIESALPQHRARLAGLLWSDAPEKRALHNLRQALSSLRKSLRDDARNIPFLLIQRDTVQINHQSDIWVDVIAFESGLTAALQPRQPGGLHSRLNLRLLQQSVTYFRGPFLDQLYLNGSPLFDEWASLKREALSQRMVQALSLLAEFHERRGEIPMARQYASQLVSLAPWDETAQIQVMRFLAVEGQWSAAQAQYHHLRRYLSEQVGVEPTIEATDLFEQIRQAAARNVNLPVLQPVARHNLPAPTASLIGREEEIDAISASLADPCCHLLTVFGTGGVGKSHLALEAARWQVGSFTDGVYFVPLVDLTADVLLPESIAEAVGFSFYGNDSTATQLLRFFSEKHLLLLLDNFEQLLPLSAESLIVQILQQAPGVVLLVTSRQRLNLQEECLLPLTGLAIPLDNETPDNQPRAALQLFASRAQRLQPGFNLDNQANRQAATMICQLLEGLPLGVEIAAAALWSHTIDEIAADLSNSLHSLENAAINASDRHRSLWAAFDVSWRLLSAEEHQLLAQLSIFRGGFEGDMAQQAYLIRPALLASLHDKSLLRRSSTGRYDLHEAIRQFAAEKLAADPALEDSAKRSHAHLLAAFLAERADRLKSAEQVQALAEIAMEWGNVRQAWNWLVTTHSATELAACAETVFNFCMMRARLQEGIELFSQAEKGLGTAPGAQAKILTYLGVLAYRMMSTDLCEDAINRAMQLYDTIDQPADRALCCVFASGLASRQKNHERALQLCEKALEIFTTLGDSWGQSYAWFQLGLLKRRAGKFVEARQAIENGLEAARVIGDQHRQIGPINMLGDLDCQQGAYLEAQTRFEEALALSRDLDDHFNIAQGLLYLGTTHHSLGHFDLAHQCYEESLVISQEFGDLSNRVMALINLAELVLELERFPEGLTYSQQGLALAVQANDEWAELICWINLADAALGLQDEAGANQYLSRALPMAVQMNDPALELRILLHHARLYLLRGQNHEAYELFGLVLHHEATYEEHRQAVLKVLEKASIPLPDRPETTLETVLKNLEATK